MLTEYGYQRPTYEEIVEDTEELAKELFGEDIVTDEHSVLGKIIRIIAYISEKQWEDAENIYFSRFPNAATGISLDKLCPFVGVTRNPATYAEYTITVNGEAGTEVEEIVVCGDNPEIVFHNLAPFTIGEDGATTIEVECETVGTEGNSITITEIVNPIAGIDSVSNSIQTKAAEDIETDYNLRRRFAQATEGAGGSNINAVRASILKVSTVKSVSVVENSRDVADADGRPPHSFECYIYGGEGHEQEIAEAIFETKPLGIQSVGNEQAAIVDSTGNEQIINFTFAEDIPVLVKVEIRVDNNYPADGNTQITNNISEYINNLGLGKSLMLSALYGYIHDVVGVTEVTELTLSTNGGSSYNASNVTVPAYNAVVCGGVNVEAIT